MNHPMMSKYSGKGKDWHGAGPWPFLQRGFQPIDNAFYVFEKLIIFSTRTWGRASKPSAKLKKIMKSL